MTDFEGPAKELGNGIAVRDKPDGSLMIWGGVTGMIQIPVEQRQAVAEHLTDIGVLEQHFTKKQLEDNLKKNRNRVVAVIPVCLCDLIENDMEWLNDLAEELILGRLGDKLGYLLDLNYHVVGFRSGGKKGETAGGYVLIEVNAEFEER